jgi:hypothetical protein
MKCVESCVWLGGGWVFNSFALCDDGTVRLCFVGGRARQFIDAVLPEQVFRGHWGGLNVSVPRNDSM